MDHPNPTTAGPTPLDLDARWHHLRAFLRLREAEGHFAALRGGRASALLPVSLWHEPAIKEGALALAREGAFDVERLMCAVSFAQEEREQDRRLGVCFADFAGRKEALLTEYNASETTSANTANFSHRLENVGTPELRAKWHQVARVYELLRQWAEQRPHGSGEAAAKDAALWDALEHLLALREAASPGGYAEDVEVVLELALLDPDGDLFRRSLYPSSKAAKKKKKAAGVGQRNDAYAAVYSAITKRDVPRFDVVKPPPAGGETHCRFDETFRVRLFTPTYEAVAEKAISGDYKHRTGDGWLWLKRATGGGRGNALDVEDLVAHGFGVRAFRGAREEVYYALYPPALLHPYPQTDVHPGLRAGASSADKSALEEVTAWLRCLPEQVARPAGGAPCPPWLEEVRGWLLEVRGAPPQPGGVNDALLAALWLGRMAVVLAVLKHVPCGRDAQPLGGDKGAVDRICEEIYAAAAAADTFPFFAQWRVPKDLILRRNLLWLAAAAMHRADGGCAAGFAALADDRYSAVDDLVAQLCRWPRRVAMIAGDAALPEALKNDQAYWPQDLNDAASVTHRTGVQDIYDLAVPPGAAILRDLYAALAHDPRHAWREKIPCVVPLTFTLVPKCARNSDAAAALSVPGGVRMCDVAVGRFASPHARLPVAAVVQRIVAEFVRAAPCRADMVLSPCPRADDQAYTVTFPDIPVERRNLTAVRDAVALRMTKWLRAGCGFSVGAPAQHQYKELRNVLQNRFDPPDEYSVLPFRVLHAGWAWSTRRLWERSTYHPYPPAAPPVLTSVELAELISVRRFAAAAPADAWWDANEVVYPCLPGELLLPEAPQDPRVAPPAPEGVAAAGGLPELAAAAPAAAAHHAHDARAASEAARLCGHYE